MLHALITLAYMHRNHARKQVAVEPKLARVGSKHQLPLILGRATHSCEFNGAASHKASTPLTSHCPCIALLAGTADAPFHLLWQSERINAPACYVGPRRKRRGCRS